MADKKEVVRDEKGRIKKIKAKNDEKDKKEKAEKEDKPKMKAVIFKASHNKLMLKGPKGRITFNEGFYEAKDKAEIDFLLWKTKNPQPGVRVDVFEKRYK